MGLREKIALVLTTLAITTTTTQCVPSGSKTAALQRHLEARGIKSTQSLFDNVAKVTKTTPPKRSMYKAYNFPETEYPVDSSPRDPFYYGIDPVGLAEHEAPNQNFKAYNDMKKDMRMKRKLDMINENYQVSTDPEPLWLKDKAMFPEVQYPLKSMDTWAPFYGYPSILTQNEQRQKFSELLFEKSKRIPEPHKEDMKLKTKRLLDEINKIKEKISSSKSHSKSGTDSTGLYNTKQPDTNQTQMLFQTTDAVNDELLASNSTSNSSETEDLSKQLDTTNITTISEELPMSLNTAFHNTSVMPMPIPYKACELRNKTDTGGLKNEDIRFEEPEPSIILGNEGNSSFQTNASMQSIDNSTSMDNTGDNFQKVLTDALIELILTHISSKKNKKNQALFLDDTDTTCTDSDAKSAFVKEEQDADLLPNDAHKQQGIDLMSNDDPLSIKLPFPASSKDESIPTHVSIKNDTQMSDVNKAPCSPIIVIPVGDTINEIQLPIVETTTGTPIIVFIPTTQQSDISVSPSTNIQGDSNVSFGNHLNISFISESSQNPDVLSSLNNLQQTSIRNIPINIHKIRNATSVKPDYETPSKNSTCHFYPTQDEMTNVTQQNNDTFIENHVPVIDIVPSQGNPSSESLIEPYPKTCVNDVASDEKIIAIDQIPIIKEVLAKPLLLDDNTNKDTNIVSTKENSLMKLEDNIDSNNIFVLNVEDNVSLANIPANVSKALVNSSSVSNDHKLPNQNEIMNKTSNDVTVTDINDLATIKDEVLVKPSANKMKVTENVSSNETNSTRLTDGMGISEPKNDMPNVKEDNVFIEINKEITPLNELLETLDANEVDKNNPVLDKISNEVNNKVLADTFLEDRNIKGRSLSGSTNESLLNNTLQSNKLKDIIKDTPMPMKDDLEVSQNTLIPEDKHLLSVQNADNKSPTSKNNTLLSNILTNTTKNDPQLIIPNDEIVEVFTKDTQKASKVMSKSDALTNDSDDSLNSRVNQLLEQNQLINTTDSLVHKDLSDSLLQDTISLDKNQDSPHLVNPSLGKNEDKLDVIEDNDFFSIPFDIIKDGLSLPKGMLICSGISEVPRNVKNGTLLNDEIASSQVIKQPDITNANMESDEAILTIPKVLQETSITEIAKNEIVTKEEIRQVNELTVIEKAVSNNSLDTASMNKTEFGAANITFDRDVAVSMENTLPDLPHSNIVDNNNTVKKEKKRRKSNSKKSLKELSDTNLSEAIKESQQLTVDKTSTTTPKDSTADKKALERLSSDSQEILDAPKQEAINKLPESAENYLTSAELSGLIKYLYDAV